MGFPRQEYRSGLPFPSPGDLPDPVIEPESPELAGGFFTTEPPGKPNIAVQLPRGQVLMKKGKLGLPLTLATLAKEQALQILSFLQDGASGAAAVFRLFGELHRKTWVDGEEFQNQLYLLLWFLFLLFFKQTLFEIETDVLVCFK